MKVLYSVLLRPVGYLNLNKTLLNTIQKRGKILF